jgi:hypothetical protein
LKSNEQLKKEYYQLREADINNLKIIKTEIDSFISRNKVDEEGLRIINNITMTLGAFKESYLTRLINFLKQGHQIS